MRSQLFCWAVACGAALSMAAGCAPSNIDESAPSSSLTTLPEPEPGESGSAEPAAAGPLVVLCGSSFQPPMLELLSQFHEESGVDYEISVGGSEDLLPHVKLKAQGDVFVTHDPYMQYTEDAGALLRWVHVGYVAPVLVVQKGNPKQIASIEDLAKPGLRVILPNPDFSTCGEMVFRLLEKKGVKEAVLKNVNNAMFRSHADIGNKMKLGLADAAIMWNGVAHGFQDAIQIVPVPYEYDEEIRVGVIGLSYSQQPQRVEQFLKFVDEHGKSVFEKFGYVK